MLPDSPSVWKDEESSFIGWSGLSTLLSAKVSKSDSRTPCMNFGPSTIVAEKSGLASRGWTPGWWGWNWVSPGRGFSALLYSPAHERLPAASTQLFTPNCHPPIHGFPPKCWALIDPIDPVETSVWPGQYGRTVCGYGRGSPDCCNIIPIGGNCSLQRTTGVNVSLSLETLVWSESRGQVCHHTIFYSLVNIDKWIRTNKIVVLIMVLKLCRVKVSSTKK